MLCLLGLLAGTSLRAGGVSVIVCGQNLVLGRDGSLVWRGDMTAAGYGQLEAVDMQPLVECVGKEPDKAVLLQAG